VRSFCTILVGLLFICPSNAQRDIQSLTVQLAPTASDAVIPISIWTNRETPQGVRTDSQVIGTGFLINTNGDFITAGHVLDELERTKKIPNIKDANLTAMIRQRDGNSSGQYFTTVDRDADHDLVLCHIATIKAVPLAQSKVPKNLEQHVLPRFASLSISTAAPQTGRFVVVSGFPLGSWTPTVQVGMVAAIETMNPREVIGHLIHTVIHKDARDLLQISVYANHGNSGGPVIDLSTGQVIGVIDQLLPAPLQVGQQILNESTFSASGIMLAAPARWVVALLEKNHIKSEAVPAGRLVAW
jgi:S1-C subfamily serine protease